MNIEELINEQKRINDILSKAKNDIEKSPEGSLRITRSKSTPCYYYRKNSSDRSGTYINAKEIDLARKLAQKGYAMDVIRYLEPMAGLIDNVTQAYRDSSILTITSGYNEARRKLITPYELNDEEYISEWIRKTTEQLQKYKQSKDYIAHSHVENIAFTTAKGEAVRSKSEVILADTFLRYGIPYQYELPYVYRGEVVFRPDFTILNVRKRKIVYIEHFGKMDSESYRDSFFWKMKNFEKWGLIQGKNLLMTFEDYEHPFDIAAYIKDIKYLCTM